MKIKLEEHNIEKQGIVYKIRIDDSVWGVFAEKETALSMYEMVKEMNNMNTLVKILREVKL